MRKEQLRGLLSAVRTGNLSVDEALERLKTLPYEDLGFAKIDHHRALRKGFPEAIFCLGKSAEQVADIVQSMLPHQATVLATRANEGIFTAIRAVAQGAVYHPLAQLVVIGGEPEASRKGMVLVLSGGTADLPVAEEAAVTAEAMGSRVQRLYDVGVAGLHRLLDQGEKLFAARVVVVVAGMEGALASVVGGLVACPVIAVPTSVGYGASFQGLAALLGMLNSCAPGVAVVNIDNGFGAGYLASIINRLGQVTE
ncbi:MAG: nickel pincer cofactor biosynthesis protein LarB [Chloroflexi bacterium]|nr:nickel pincer cofactor biosynthesis protein LarB [Chloroflexota bacterium]